MTMTSALDVTADPAVLGFDAARLGTSTCFSTATSRRAG